MIPILLQDVSYASRLHLYVKTEDGASRSFCGLAGHFLCDRTHFEFHADDVRQLPERVAAEEGFHGLPQAWWPAVRDLEV